MPAPTHMALMRIRTTSLSGARPQPFGLSVHANLQRLRALSSDPTDVRAQGGAMSASALRLAARELRTVYCSARAYLIDCVERKYAIIPFNAVTFLRETQRNRCCE
ncbi:hypothetical protein K438DRAFT_814887 [Mycena galopus ATCC 62051]|nr:hypothetical protein K438DRAFT_814887 [Mycena galopus ATCC 62051]